MEQHPIPRQITTFEFKLIGFLTLRQFLYLAVFCSIGYIIYAVIPVPYLNIILGILVGAIGLLFAFLRFNERSLDIWIKNFIRRINSPTQYIYQKKNESIYFIKNLFFMNDPHIVLAHVESKEKLAEYLQKKQVAEKTTQQQDKQKMHIQDLLRQNLQVPSTAGATLRSHRGSTPFKSDGSIVHQPFVTGVVKNRKQIPIPGIIVTIKDESGRDQRLLKTNPYGVFATYSPLPDGEYLLEIGDPNGNYFFDTMKIHLGRDQNRPLVFYSKEIL
ncbi:hypothetical protein A3A93_05930 [Candidatus Roizmanbacteria bacterium RIFCSPLOWO2_01_FULL_38_12]|uniref:PrgI family protein n=1 Tax=Candidatus Roizmanbacteria bacterium RIFCSPLOWO2_01_FULL_38_12 TaxID=1802061 RepID=A0A1F7IVB9_9BACT|nr:MAG: hypothetical protein A2861_02930 [Candidatus Roizmanbacteria bacterium RIFCSPHIGHO2_01_FULL_38_15]OGK36257.1 MAG: hypothetical protein A3F59_00070 [Candidatus Roizmanbacteria bacterium RIFCSPHIGHO2_12_FULL_38_13]OGK47297.1 MAG: hypothetical protein A3A93_05930 [Candidatus Roizmanbacteria bacterium RIFCSPLOWO2_01_FULL_38_12]